MVACLPADLANFPSVQHNLSVAGFDYIRVVEVAAVDNSYCLLLTVASATGQSGARTGSPQSGVRVRASRRRDVCAGTQSGRFHQTARF